MNNKFELGYFWKDFPPEKLNKLVEEIYDECRKSGFPYYTLTDEQKIKEYTKLKKYSSLNEIIEGDIVKQTMHGLALAWSFFPHSFNIICNDKKTPLDIFNDDILFKKAIHKRLKYGTYISESGIRKTLKTFTGTQSVSNFRPTAASGIYKYFNAKNVYDMSAGFGGRMLGASVTKVENYTYVEPSSQTFAGLDELSFFIKPYTDTTFNGIKNIGSEDYIPDRNSFDLCFTSPPYFNTEKYSNENTQSYIKFTTKESWLKYFLQATFENCHYGLRDNCYMVINIANTKSYPLLEEDTCKVAAISGFRLEKVLRLVLSSIIGSKHLNKYKYEPVFIFKKI